MTTKREQALAAAAAALSTVTGLGSGGVCRSRQDKFMPTELPAINVKPDSSRPGEETIGKVDDRLMIVVEVFARAASSTQAPETAADPIVEQVHAKLFADPTFGGLAIDIAEAGTDWQFDEADRASVMVELKFTLWTRHSRASLTT